ncbi:MAG TPA: recombinase family protein [Candidatus Limnocylindrales bacterium]|nr:recombinase family protein [Candidatus Limnocylindrales bacterium]
MVVTTAAIYARISSDPTGDQLGVRRQLDDCQREAERRGWPVADLYVDDDTSAWSGHRRPEYQRLCADIEARRVDAVVVWHLDRLTRSPRELEDFVDLCDRPPATPIAWVSGDFDISTGDGRFMARILAAMARKESDDKSRRIRRKHLELAESGEWAGGGSRPFGYLADRRSLDPDEAAAVREAVARVLAGDSLRSVAADFNDRDIRTSTGRPWTIQSLRRMLHSGRISGQREHHGRIVGPGKWEAIITPDETARLRARFADHTNGTRRSSRRYLLTGLLRCSICGASLVARPRADGTRRYVCAEGPGFAGCGRLVIMAEPCEQLIADAVLHRLDSPALAAALRAEVEGDEAATSMVAGLEADEAQLAEIAGAYGRREVTFPEFLAARKPIEARIEATKRHLSKTHRSAALADYVGDSSSLRERWSTLDLSRQRAIVEAVLDRAVVRPAVRGRNRFDPDRVDPFWRF